MLLNAGGGNFRALSQIPLPDSPGDIDLGDLNGDSNLDLAIDSHDSYGVIVMLGDGKGGLALAPNSPIVMKEGSHPHTHGLAIGVMVALSRSLTLWVLLPAPVVAVAVWFFGKTIHDLYEKIQAALATLTAKVQENLSGVRIIRAYAQEEAEILGFDEPNLEYVSRNIKLIRTWSMFMPSLTALIPNACAMSSP